MSLTETKKPSSRAKAPFAKKAAAPKVTNGRKKRCDIHDPHAPLPPIINAEQVLTFAQWCALNALSERTGRRVLASGEGPAVTKLSIARIGITVSANRAWQNSRTRA